jgi:hypothetical protein
VQALAGLQRFERQPLHEHVLLQHTAREPEQIQLGLVHEQQLPAMPRAPGRMPVADEPPLDLGHHAVHVAHRLTAPSGEPEGAHHACPLRGSIGDHPRT